MLQLFRDNQFINAIFIILYFAFFSINIWLYPNDIAFVEEVQGTFNTLFFAWVDSPVKNKIFFNILVLVQVFLLNFIVNYFKLAKNQTFIPAVCFIVLHFLYENIDCCTPVLLANTFLLWAMFSLFASYEKRVSMGTIFNIGFAVGLSTLFYHGHAVYFLWALAGLFVVRSFEVQEFIIMTGGYFVPFFLMGTFHFISGDLGLWIENDLLVHYKTMNLQFIFDFQLYLLLGGMVFCYFFAFLNMQNIYFKTTSKVKKYITAVFIMPMASLLSFFLQSNLYSFHFLTFFIPISILLSLAIQSQKKPVLSEAIHFILFMICIGIQYQTLFFG